MSFPLSLAQFQQLLAGHHIIIHHACDMRKEGRKPVLGTPISNPVQARTLCNSSVDFCSVLVYAS